MESVDIPSETVPEEMKACEQILRRAKELKKAEPVVAYWCTGVQEDDLSMIHKSKIRSELISGSFSAAQKALKVSNRSGEGTKWLMSLLDALEGMKAVLGSNEAVTNEAAGAAYIENFALKVFMGADNEDRKGTTGKGTIRKFVVAGQFIEVLKCFENGMTEEMEQKLQYARWKAADGAKALREGRQPTPGPPLPEEAIDPFPALPSDEPIASSPPPRRDGSFSSLTRPTISSGSPSGSGNRTPTNASSPGLTRANLPSIDTSSDRVLKRTQSATSGAWSTVATPGLPDSEDGESRFNLQQKAQLRSIEPEGPITPTDERAELDGEKKNVRFMGPDGAPLSPATTYISTDSYDVPDAPPPTTFSPSPKKTDGQSAAKIPAGRPRTDSAATLNDDSYNSQPQAPKAENATAPRHAVSQFPPPPPPSLSEYPSAPPNTLGLSSPPPSAPPQSALSATSTVSTVTSQPTSVPVIPTRKQVEAVQKHARWAISALDFDDYETARSELRKALATLGG